MAEEEQEERTEDGGDAGESRGDANESSADGGSASRTALTAVVIGAAAAGVAIAARKLMAALRDGGEEPSANGGPSASADEDLATVLRKTALDIAVAAASAATGYLSSDDDGEGDPED